ncbi:hypothetical protein B0O80DRAFT_140315 [Mortierella sp. GBAus27b]|nr:hypothetical protein B0O80DRAFT_140315 [Mortierella sp. GBAus27b]
MIVADGEWIRDAEKLVGGNEDRPRLKEAFMELQDRSPIITLQESLRILQKNGLVVDVDESHPSLQHLVCSSMNHAPTSHSPSATFRLDDRRIPIPPRSKLFLLYLAHSLHCTIYLFSGRSKPIVFDPPSPKSAIGLLHAIDPTGEMSSMYPIVAATTGPRDSRQGSSLQNARAGRSVAVTSSSVPAATWRDGPRVRQLAPSQQYLEISQRECVESLERTFTHSLESRIRSIVKTTLEKKRKADETPESVLHKAEESTRDQALTQKHVPRGSMSETAKDCRVTHGLDNGFQEPQLQKKLGPNGNNIKVWQEVVRDKFDDLWSACAKEALGRGNGSTAPTKKDAPGIRVCTTTLKNILRPEFTDEKCKDLERIVGTIESCQDDVTDVIDELSVIVEKLHIEVSYGHP